MMAVNKRSSIHGRKENRHSHKISLITKYITSEHSKLLYGQILSQNKTSGFTFYFFSLWKFACATMKNDHLPFIRLKNETKIPHWT